MNLIVWMNIPSHHQSQFFDALNKICTNFAVHYYGKALSNRSEMGWDSNVQLKSYEKYIDVESYQINLKELKDYIHILPGYGHPLLIKLRQSFSKNNIKWVHWSEKATPGWKWYASYYKKFLHAYYVNNYAFGALAIGNHARNDFIRWGIKPEKIGILPYSFNTMNIFPPDEEILKFKKGRKAFLFVGSLYALKGIDLLLKAFHQEFKDNKDWCMILVGNIKDGSDYQKVINDYHLNDQVLIRGVIPASQITSAYSACDIFVLPSRYDGWGMVVNEAVYCNLPVIASDAVGASEHLVQSEKNGFIFKSGSSDSLAEQMVKYKNFQIISEHGKYNSEIFSKYSSDSLSKHLVDILKTWMSKK